jgi:hypothetical protein
MLKITVHMVKYWLLLLARIQRVRLNYAIIESIIVNMRARTTNQIDWWHARLTSLASAVTL